MVAIEAVRHDPNSNHILSIFGKHIVARVRAHLWQWGGNYCGVYLSNIFYQPDFRVISARYFPVVWGIISFTLTFFCFHQQMLHTVAGTYHRATCIVAHCDGRECWEYFGVSRTTVPITITSRPMIPITAGRNSNRATPPNGHENHEIGSFQTSTARARLGQ